MASKTLLLEYDFGHDVDEDDSDLTGERLLPGRGGDQSSKTRANNFEVVRIIPKG